MTGKPEPGERPDDEALWRLYGYAVDEYRFQVNLNWQRLQYFIGLNVAILGVGTGLLRLGTNAESPPDNTLPGLVFVAGVVLSAAAFYLARTQQNYYRSARDRMTKLGSDLADAGNTVTLKENLWRRATRGVHSGWTLMTFW